MGHDFDEEGVCVACGFDGAEWHWWRHSTYEGRSQPDAKQPRCKSLPPAQITPVPMSGQDEFDAWRQS